MKIFFYASQGGHFNEAMMIVDQVVRSHPDITMITFDSPEMKDLGVEVMFLSKVSWSSSWLVRSSLAGLINIPRIFMHMVRNRPDVVLSTGSGQLAIPALIMADILGIPTIYVETWTRVKNPSVAGKVLYYFTDHFLVQWEDLLPRFGKKAKFLGGLL